MVSSAEAARIRELEQGNRKPADDCQSVRDEFGRPTPTFLEDELAATARFNAEEWDRRRPR